MERAIIERINDPIPIGMPSDEISGYISSIYFQRRSESLISRRQLIIGSSVVCTICSVSPAQSVGVSQLKELIEVGLASLQLAKTLWDVGSPIFGHFSAKNDDPSKSKNGNTLLVVLSDERSEGSTYWKVQIPRETSVVVKFSNGPPPKTEGMKTFAVYSSNDQISREFTAA